MKIIFLDFDGVLNSRPFLEELSKRWAGDDMAQMIDPSAVELLNKIVRATGASVVISSTWRKGRSLAVLKDFLRRRGFKGQVIDKTPVGVGVERGEEISAWLARHGAVSFVILDDDADMGDLMHRLVQTDTATGLTEADAQLAIEMLNGSS